MVICLERGADLYLAQLMPLPLTVSCFSERVVNRAALTGKHDTLVRRAPGWQGAPDGQQAKKLVVTKCLFYSKINIL